jgi:hypothetical protein
MLILGISVLLLKSFLKKLQETCKTNNSLEAGFYNWYNIRLMLASIVFGNTGESLNLQGILGKNKDHTAFFCDAKFLMAVSVG